MFSIGLEVLAGLAEVAYRQDEHRKALQLAVFIEQNPATKTEIQAQAARIADRSTLQLSADQSSLARQRGQSMTFEEAISI